MKGYLHPPRHTCRSTVGTLEKERERQRKERAVDLGSTLQIFVLYNSALHSHTPNLPTHTRTSAGTLHVLANATMKDVRYYHLSHLGTHCSG